MGSGASASRAVLRRTARHPFGYTAPLPFATETSPVMTEVDGVDLMGGRVKLSPARQTDNRVDRLLPIIAEP
jgi:hypothetical protein